MPSNAVQESILLLLCLGLIISCESTLVRVVPRDLSDIDYHAALSKNRANTYWDFIRRYPKSSHADEAKEKLAKLLVEQKDKKDLTKYIKVFPERKHLVEDVLREIEITEKINAHLRTKLEDGSRVVVRPGEVINSHGYFKAYLVRRNKLEDIGEPTYEARLEKVMAPKFIKLELLTDRSFIMVERFHALVNLYYKIKVSSAAPPGEYRVAAIIGAYQIFSPEKEHRKGGKKVDHVIEVVEHPLNSMEMLEVDFEAVRYFKQKQDKMKAVLKDSKSPKGSFFGTQYMYKYNLTNHNIQLEEYTTSQAEAGYHLQQALDSPLPEIVSQAQDYLTKLRDEGLFVEYKPVE